MDQENIKISDEVIGVITGIAASEVKGVASLTGSMAWSEVFGGKKSNSKGVKVEVTENGNVKIDIHVIVEYGARIPEIAWEIQENTKKAVESMTGMTVEKVNIHVDGLAVEKDTAKEKNAKAEVAPEPEAEE